VAPKALRSARSLSLGSGFDYVAYPFVVEPGCVEIVQKRLQCNLAISSVSHPFTVRAVAGHSAVHIVHLGSSPDFIYFVQEGVGAFEDGIQRHVVFTAWATRFSVVRSGMPEISASLKVYHVKCGMEADISGLSNLYSKLPTGLSDIYYDFERVACFPDD
jgi:hypothetical protein